MTIAATLERARRNEFAVPPHPLWGRVAVITGFIVVDLLCFSLADLALNLGSKPPALALFPGRSVDAPSMVVDLIGLLAIFFVMTRYFVGDYSRRQLFWDSARHTTTALFVCGVIYLAAMMLLAPSALFLSAAVWLGLIFLLPAARQGARFLLGKAGLWHLPTAILGASAAAQEVYPVLAKQLSLGLDVRWVVPESPEKLLPAAFSNLKVLLAQPDDIAGTLVAAGCRQVIVVPDDQLRFNQNDLIDQLIGADIRVAIVPSLRRLPLFGLSASYFFGKDLLLLQVRNNLARLPQRFIKRTLDIVGACAVLCILWPLFAIFALLIRMEDGGPVFFLQNRIGRHGQKFRCLKFRTMAVDAEAQMERWAHENPLLLSRYRESNFKLKSDPRVTPIGSWLRRTSLDELPQIINILLGDMSLVGPRPLLAQELPDYGAVITLYERVRPGITGLWQISGRSHTTFAERVSYDEWYIKNWTVWYDVVIILQTFWVLLRGEGAY